MMRSHLLAITTVLGVAGVAPTALAQKTFPTPQAAATALVEAAKADDMVAIREVLGPEADDVLTSGDPVDDANARKWFADRASEKMAIEPEDDEWAVLAIGENAWPFAIPLHKGEKGWAFDVEEGKEELLDRRIGGNELVAISVARAFVDAQREYAEKDLDGDGKRDYAGRILSSDGARDGLYWPTENGETPSPFGPLIAEATAKGYERDPGGAPAPYEGYRFKVLTRQGPHASGGERSYEENGDLTTGFGLLAWPASYGASGIKTFVVNQLGIVFEKDLGPETGTVAPAIAAYDPDRTWTPSPD